MTTDYFLLSFVALVLEVLIYGGYCVVFAGSIWVLVKRRRAAESQPVSYVIDGCSWFIFVTLTIHLICSVYFRYEGLITHGSNVLEGTLYLIDSSSVPSLVRATMYGISAVAMDVMLIYRLWIVWGRSWAVTVLPVILTLFNAAGLFYCLHLSAAAGLLASLDSTIQVWSSVLFTFEALTNMYCAVLIAMRIVRDSMILKSNIGSSVQHILWIIVESAAIYTIFTFFIMGGILARLPEIIVFMDIVPPIAGITSCLLVVRVGLGMAADNMSRPHSVSLSRGMTFGRKTNATDSVELQVAVTRHALVSRDIGPVTSLPHRRGDSSAMKLGSSRGDMFGYSSTSVASSPAGVDVC